jgi:hypothetical protein
VRARRAGDRVELGKPQFSGLGGPARALFRTYREVPEVARRRRWAAERRRTSKIRGGGAKLRPPHSHGRGGNTIFIWPMGQNARKLLKTHAKGKIWKQITEERKQIAGER